MYSLTGYQLYDIATVISRTGGLNIGSLYVRLSTEITCNQVTSVYSQVRRPGKTEGECSLIEISSESNRINKEKQVTEHVLILQLSCTSNIKAQQQKTKQNKKRGKEK